MYWLDRNPLRLRVPSATPFPNDPEHPPCDGFRPASSGGTGAVTRCGEPTDSALPITSRNAGQSCEDVLLGQHLGLERL